MEPDATFSSWIDALDRRHLADLTVPEIGRALRALSSCYVERRSRLAEGAALEGAGKRAAFGLFYAPLHFLTVARIVGALDAGAGIREIVDLGCGTGAAGAAWALAAPGARVSGFDRSGWAIVEANWTLRALGVPGRAARQDLGRVQLQSRPGLAVLAGYVVNELPEDARSALLPHLLEAGKRGATVLIVEPIARRMAPWWASWSEAFLSLGGRADEWRFTATLPPRQAQLARSAGLNPRELTARSLFLPGAPADERKPYGRIPAE